MKFDLNVLFVLRRAQTDRKSLAPISLRITVNGGRAELATGRKIDPKKWSNKSQRAVGRSEEARTLNDYLDGLETTIRRNYNSLSDSQIDISAEILRDMLNGKHRKDYTFHSLILKYTLNE